MHRRASSLLSLFLALCLFTGCSVHITPYHAEVSDPEDRVPVITDAHAEEVTFPEITVPEATEIPSFTAYTITVRSPKLAVHSGPGYSYDIVAHITDQGEYTIIAHESELLGDDRQITWGRLQSESGWINLDDASAGGFESYLFKIQNPYLEIYSGPGYSYGYVGSITDQGTYTIVEESIQCFTGGRYVTWGKLKSGVGWICLDDANLTPELPPPFRCTECGRADVYISRYALCDPCYNKLHPAPYGTCAVCGDALTYEEYETNDGFVCFDCLVCGWCGDPISIMDITAFSTYMCRPCYEAEYCCGVCGADCFSSGTVDGMCEDCYRATYFPEDPCSNCGADCSYRGSVDGLCYDCYEALYTVYCVYCGNPCYSWDEGNVCSDCLEQTES